MSFNNHEYKLVGQKDDKLIIRVKKMSNQTVVITKEVGNVIFDFDHQQYNSDHRNERHQDKFFKKNLVNQDINMMDTLVDRRAIEVASVYDKNTILDKITEKEDQYNWNQLANQLPNALANLTSNQRYAVTQYYCNGIKKNQIAKKMGISKAMAGRHVKTALKKLRQYYGVQN